MHKLIYSITTAVFVLFTPLAFSQSNVQAEADKILNNVQTFMSTQKSVEIEADVTEEEVYGDAHKLQFGGTLKILIKRPTQLSVTNHSDYKNTRAYLNNGIFTLLDEDVNVYAQAPAPGTFGEALASIYAKTGAVPDGAELFSGRAYELLVGKASKVVYIGKSNVNGNSCHHIAGILPDMDWQLWVRAEGDPVLCKYVVTDRAAPMAPQFTMTFTQWKSNADLSDKQFEFQPPADAEAIEIIN